MLKIRFRIYQISHIDIMGKNNKNKGLLIKIDSRGLYYISRIIIESKTEFEKNRSYQIKIGYNSILAISIMVIKALEKPIFALKIT